MTNEHKLCTEVVKTNEKVPDFLHAVLTPDYHLKNVAEFRKRLNRNRNTTASLREVLRADRILRRHLGASADHLLSGMSIDHLKMNFGEDYLSEPDIHKFLRTDLSMWDLVNEITAISSKIEQQKIKVEERTNLMIQTIGGDVMFRSPDLGPNNIRQVY